ncbi:hypothetical protein PoB_003674400 [Plakobranchus ocellatus]|uniref:Uncharacterized protein n=1 Tax=Plakobranchus ocellatus TaxID=259542 RepID=A0AAV4AV48_9GAST|nr:hypothetical protein PoB_003674400 [Plakobranchus ocellatus]
MMKRSKRVFSGLTLGNIHNGKKLFSERRVFFHCEDHIEDALHLSSGPWDVCFPIAIKGHPLVPLVCLVCGQLRNEVLTRERCKHHSCLSMFMGLKCFVQ